MRTIPSLPNGIKKGDFVVYTNGQPSFYTGTVVKVMDDKKTVVVIDEDNEAEVTLWNAGTAAGTELYGDQIHQLFPAEEFEPITLK